MGRKPKFIENLTEEEKYSLKQGYLQGKSPIFRRKCHSILLSHSRKTIFELSSFFDVSDQTVRSWLKQWQSNGLAGLELQAGRGRKPKLKIDKAEHVETVKTLVENEPQNLHKVTAQIHVELGVKLSKKTLKRFLKNLNTNGNAFEKD